MKSVWNDTFSLAKSPQLKEDKNTDVLIIGGGIAGILTAYRLQKAGIDYILVEKDRICSHTTQNTTAKITYQHGLIYNKISDSKGTETAKMYLQANRMAFDEYHELCKNIDCDYEKKDNYVYSTDDRKKLETELKVLSLIGGKAELSENLPIPVKTVGAVKVANQAQFHPLKFVNAIIDGLNIYENTHVVEMVGTTAITEHGKINAKKVIIATHYPFINKHGSYFVKLYQHRSYVIALENAQNVAGMYVDDSDKGMSFRNYGNLLLLGGGSHRTGKYGGNWNELRNYAKNVYPNSQENYHWSTQDCMSLDSLPYIGNYSKRTPALYVATGFNKWGMTGAMLSSILLSDMITDKQNEYLEIFNPSRNILKPQLFVNIAESTKNLLTPTTKRCPHLGCALKWNSVEHSWDCPCHGSRFSEHGKLIDNPANGDINTKSV